ncbi:MAG: hypothetical protein WBN11_00265 [Eudoraea sp.]|uniref:hypothetical protein n=2 Tax=Eudoraea sp. TaxID=1979955 RepID=UPI003C76EA16
MQNPLIKYRDNFNLKLDQNPDILGLSDFIRRLEKDYFSEVTVRTIPADRDQINLIIELDCTFNLVEVLSQLQKGNWGTTISDGTASPQLKALNRLRQLNDSEIDVEEFSIFLKDSSIVIKNIFKNSIQDQLNLILQSIAAHYVHFTKKLTETPYEIYIPVFEEDLFENNTQIRDIRISNNQPKDYFNYWGLYFESEEDALIYKLKDKSFIPGDLLMLNDY